MGKDNLVLSPVAENAANAFNKVVDQLVMERLTGLPTLNATHAPEQQGGTNHVANIAAGKDQSRGL